MLSRKSFIEKSTAAAVGLSLFDFMKPLHAKTLLNKLERLENKTPNAVAQDEDFWRMIRLQYSLSTNIINLNNGGVSPQPIPVQEAHIKNYHLSNEGPSYYMWRVLDQGREPLRQKLANMAGVSPEEIAFNRNTTEGLNTIIFGLNLKKGDEVVLCKYDYPNMMNAWKQREKRDGIKLNWVDLNLPEEDDNAIVAKYAAAINSATRIVHITHMQNWTGQILPVRKIADMAHSRGCEVIVDGSHSFAHINYKIPDLDCDYYATSLHKWLCAPFGTGFMFIKKDKIKNVWALLSAPIPDAENIGKFESLGTRSFAAEMAIGNAIDFHQMIGSERKEARLRYLKNYWCEKVKAMDNVKLNTSLKDNYSCAIANFSIEGMKPEDVDTKLFEMARIHAVAINHERIHGVRVTPNVYTSLYELDKLSSTINTIALASLQKK